MAGRPRGGASVEVRGTGYQGGAGASRQRLSTDIRYQNVRDAIDAGWANHWFLGDML
jgi:hypothetical protein